MLAQAFKLMSKKIKAMKLSKVATSGLKALITILLLILVFRAVDLAKIRHDLRSLEAFRLIILLLAIWVGQMLCAQRWRLLAASFGLKGRYRSFLQLYFVGMLFNIGLPSLVGGDVVKAYVLSRKTGKSMHLALASVLQDRAVGLIALLVYGSIAVPFYPMSWRGIPLWLVYVVVWAGIVVVVWLVWKGEGIYRQLPFQNFAPVKKAVDIVASFHQALVTMRLYRIAILQVTAYSLVNSALVLWTFQQVTPAAGHAVDFVAFSALFPLMALITMLPISLGGLGIREWTYVEALALVHVPGSSALLIALTTSALIIASNLAGAFFLPTIPSELRSKPPAIVENGVTD